MATSTISTISGNGIGIGTHNDDGHKNTLLLFGTLNQEIADVMYQSIKEQLMISLQALPMLNNDDMDDFDADTTTTSLTSTTKQKSRMGLLYKYLFKQYITAVDLIELYNARNTFSVHMIQPKSRQNQVLELYRKNIENANDQDKSTSDTWNDADWVFTGTTGSSSMDTEEDDAMDVDHMDETTHIPTSINGEIPTASDMETIQTDITALHERLQQLQRQHALLTTEIATMQTLQEQQRDISTPILNMKDSITNHVSQTVPVLQTLRECQNTSYQLQQQMSTIEQQRHSSNANNSVNENHRPNLNDIVVVHPNQRPKPLPKLKTIQERYEQDSFMVRSSQTDGSSDNINKGPSTVLASILTNLIGHSVGKQGDV